MAVGGFKNRNIPQKRLPHCRLKMRTERRRKGLLVIGFRTIFTPVLTAPAARKTTTGRGFSQRLAGFTRRLLAFRTRLGSLAVLPYQNEDIAARFVACKELDEFTAGDTLNSGIRVRGAWVVYIWTWGMASGRPWSLFADMKKHLVMSLIQTVVSNRRTNFEFQT
jgi:hypothetical protein